MWNKYHQWYIGLDSSHLCFKKMMKPPDPDPGGGVNDSSPKTTNPPDDGGSIPKRMRTFAGQHWGQEENLFKWDQNTRENEAILKER